MDDDDFFFGERPRPESVGFEMKDGRHDAEWREFSLFAIGRVWKIDIVLDIIGACRLYLDWMSKSTSHRLLTGQLGLLLWSAFLCRGGVTFGCG
jgi:hypothetical protein